MMTQSEYRKEYDKGWKASQGDKGLFESEQNYCRRNRLELMSPEHDAWLDGWLDYAAGRGKYHLKYCKNHASEDEGGCGQA